MPPVRFETVISAGERPLGPAKDFCTASNFGVLTVLPETSKFPAQILHRSCGLSSVGLFSGVRAPGTQLPPEKKFDSDLV